MTATRLRLEIISLFNYIKNEVLPLEFSEQVLNSALTYKSAINAYVPDYSLMDPSPISEGRGLVFFDDYMVGSRLVADSSKEQTTKVLVTGSSSYVLNYLNGSVGGSSTVPTHLSYFWNYVSVIPRWPGTTPPALPFVSMNIESSKKGPLQLGGGLTNKRTVYFDIFASSSAERDDISEVIHSSLYDRYIPIKDFSAGEYLNHSGTFNTTLSFPLPVLGTIFFTDITQRNVYFPTDFSDLNRYRSVISGTYESCVDSI